MLKRVLSVILIITVAICPSLAAHASSTNDDRYTMALDELKKLLGSYASNKADVAQVTELPPKTLDELRDDFAALGNDRFSLKFVDYIDVLLNIEEKKYGKLFLLIDMMKNSGSFAKFLEDETAKVTDGNKTLGTLDELEAYAKARKAQDENDVEEAHKQYIKCNDFLDSYERMKGYEGKYYADYEKAKQLMKNDNLADYITARGIFEELAEFDYYDSKGYLETVNYKISMLATPTPTPTPTPTLTPTATPTPTPTPTPEPRYWSSWSSWSTKSVSANSDCQVETKKQYAYIDTTYKTEYSAWSSWSGWSKTAASKSSTRDVETKTEVEYTYKTVWHYSRYRYIGQNKNYWYAPRDWSKKPNYLRDGTWQYKTSDTELPYVGNATDGTPYYGGRNSSCWYNPTTTQEIASSQNVTYYRTRTRTSKQVAVKGEQSSWSDSKPAAKEGREIVTRTLYRYRTR